MANKKAESAKRRRVLLDAAILAGYTVAEIAEAIGTTPANLRELVRRGSVRSVYGRALDKWFEDHGFSGEGKSFPENRASSVLANDLRNLANMLDSRDLDPAVKGERFRTQIMSYANMIDIIVPGLGDPK